MINISNNDTHMISIVHDFMTEYECEHILQHSLASLESSKVASPDGKGMEHEGRTGSNTWLPHHTNDVILGVANRISDTVRMP